jgi:hypothetical protein
MSEGESQAVPPGFQHIRQSHEGDDLLSGLAEMKSLLPVPELPE